MPRKHSPNNSLAMPSRTTWKILVPTFVVSGLLLFVGVGGAVYVHRANRDVSDSLDENLAAAQSAQRLVLAIRELRLKLIHFATTGDVSHSDNAQASLNLVESELHRQDVFLPEWVDSRLRYDDFRKRLNQLFLGPAGEDRREIAADLVALSYTALLAPAERLLKERQQLATQSSRENQAIARRIGVGLLLLGVCGAVAGLLIGFGIARSVHRSMVEISVPVRDMAGRLNEVVGPIHVSSDTDFSRLDGSLRMLADKTTDVVRQLQENQRQALRHEQLAAVGQLAAGLAHELRNPLMSVKLIVQTAAERADRSFNTHDLSVIEDEVTRLEKLLQSFLDFARPPQPKKQTVDVRRVIEKTLEVVQPRASQQDVQLHFSIHGSPGCVDADESQLRQVVLNLLLNALDVLPGGGNIWLNVGRDDVSPRHDPARQLHGPAARDNQRRESIGQPTAPADSSCGRWPRCFGENCRQAVRAICQHEGHRNWLGVVHLPTDRRIARWPNHSP